MNCFIFHNWGKWEVFKEDRALFSKKDGEVKFNYVVEKQKRICKKCGYTQIKKVQEY